MKNENVKNPDDKPVSMHDQVFRHFFNENELTKSFITEYLPGQITEKLDFDTLEIVKDSFIDKKLSRYFSDILYEISFLGKPAFIYLLFDHKSRQEKFTGFQLLKYMVRVWEMYFKQNKKVRHLPVIIPIVFYHGKSKWKLDTRFVSFFDEIQGLEEYVPNFRYIAYDISHLSDEEIKGLVQLKIVLTTLKYIFNPGLEEKLPDIFNLFNELKNKSKATEYLEVLLKYLATSAKDLPLEYIDKTVTRYIEEGGNIMQTIARELMEKGKLEGIQQGIKQGIQQGIQEGIQQGIRKGKLEGILEGSREEKMKIVRNSLDAGLPVKTISQISGISTYRIRKMRSKLNMTKAPVH